MVFIGTAKQFVEAGVTINGYAVCQVAVGFLAKMKLITVAGEGDKPARGRTAAVYKAESREGFEVEFD